MAEKVLIVDDDLSVNVLVSKSLQRAGFETRTAFTADEGLTRVAQERFDLIITDLRLPKIDGLEFLRRLTAMNITDTTPVIVLSAKLDAASGKTAQGLGAVDLVSKPFDVSDLVLRVRRAIERGPRAAQTNRWPKGTGPSTAAPSPAGAATSLPPAPQPPAPIAPAHLVLPTVAPVPTPVAAPPPAPPPPPPPPAPPPAPPPMPTFVPVPAPAAALSQAGPPMLVLPPIALQPPTPMGIAPIAAASASIMPPPARPEAPSQRADMQTSSSSIQLMPIERPQPLAPPPAPPIAPIAAPPGAPPPPTFTQSTGKIPAFGQAPGTRRFNRAAESGPIFMGGGAVSPAASQQPPAAPESVAGSPGNNTARRTRDPRIGGRAAQDIAGPSSERPDCVGTLDFIQVAELVRFLYLSKRSGIIEITHDNERGEVVIREGEIQRAAVYIGDNEVTRQLIACKAMFAWRGGRFRIAFCDVQAGLALPKTTAAILTETFGGNFDYSKVKTLVPPPAPPI